MPNDREYPSQECNEAVAWDVIYELLQLAFDRSGHVRGMPKDSVPRFRAVQDQINEAMRLIPVVGESDDD